MARKSTPKITLSFEPRISNVIQPPAIDKKLNINFIEKKPFKKVFVISSSARSKRALDAFIRTETLPQVTFEDSKSALPELAEGPEI